MRRILVLTVLVLGGCSTAPVADFLDRVSPGGPGPPPRPTAPPPRPPAPPREPLPRPQPRIEERDDTPPLPPVPAGYRRAPMEGEESVPPVGNRP